MRSFFFDTLMLFLLVSCSIAQTKKFTQTDVFVAGELGYHEIRVPALAVVNNEVLVAVCEGGRTAADAGDRDLVMRRSDDGGKTWSAIQVLRDEGTRTCGNPVVVMDEQQGRIHLISTVDCKKAYHSSSDDGGLTWSPFVDITAVFNTFKSQINWTRIATGSGLGIELERGDKKGRFVFTFWLTENEEYYRSAVIYSDDRGATWKPGGVSNADFDTNECSVYEATDGTLHLNMRRGGVAAAKAPPYRVVAESKDYGLTWSKSQYDEHLICPRCHASSRRYSWPEEGRTRVLFANPADLKQRVNMTVRLSYDEGQTWPVARSVYAGPSAYSSIVRLPNGDIGLLYECGEKSKYEKTAFARFPLSWLTDGKDAQ